MKKSILIALLLSILMSCEKEKNFNVCSSQTFSFFNESGNDLFDIDNLNHIDTTSLKVFNFSGDQVHVVYGKIDGIYEFDIYLAELDNKAIIHIGDLAADTVEYEFKEEGNSLFVHKVYYNGQLVKTHDHPTQCGNGDVVDIVVKPDL